MPIEQPGMPKLRWFQPTPGKLLIILLAVEGVLLLSERFKWFGFNQHKGWTVLIAVAAVGSFLLFMLFWFIVSLVFRWRFQFSIRSLLLLTVAVAIPFSWLALEMKWAREQSEAVKVLVKLGGEVIMDYDLITDADGDLVHRRREPAPAWMREKLGDDFFGNVTIVFLDNTEVSDVGVEKLKGLTQLQWLDLRNSKVSDEGVAKIQKALPNCTIYH